MGSIVNVPQDVLRPVFNVKNYGALGNGVNDTLYIQAAIDAAVATGGGRIYFPEGTYNLASIQSTGGPGRSLFIWGSNLVFEGVRGASIITAPSGLIPGGTVIAMGGMLKAANKAAMPTAFNSQKWFVFNGLTTYYNLTGSTTKGSNVITLATAAQAANFAAGDYIHIRTGQTVTASLTEPDSEINIVDSVDTNAGTLTLRLPLAKDYAQEYFISGTDGKTSTSVTANAAVYGVANATDRMLQNIAFRNLTFAGPSDANFFRADQIDGVIVEHCEFIQGRYWFDSNNVRKVWCHHNYQRNTNSAVDGIFGWPGATGITDVLNEANNFEGYGFIHIHEGAARVAACFNDITPAVSSLANASIDIRSRAYDIEIVGNEIHHNKPADLIKETESPGGGIIIGNILRQYSAGRNTISLASSGWTIGTNAGAETTSDNVILPDGGAGAPSLRFASLPTNAGFYYPGISNSVGLAFSGIAQFRWQATAIFSIVHDSGLLRFGAATDLILSRAAAAALKLGQDAASPVAQRIQAHNGSGTDKAGADLTLAGGQGTGTGTGGALILSTAPAAGSTGASANAHVERARISQAGHVILSELAANPSASDLTSGANAEDRAAIYMKADKLVIAYNRSGTVTYLTIPLDGATTTFTQSTAAP